MLDKLIDLHQRLLATIDTANRRYLYKKVHWDSQVICIHGARGVGKTTLLCQYLLEKYQTADKALYISADNIHVLAGGLLEIASRYFDMGGLALFVDEIHKYPNWSFEIKNIIDTYRDKQIVFSGSSAMELQRSKADLSRRVLYHELPGLSFREYLNFTGTKMVEPITLESLLTNPIQIAEQFADVPILKYFKDYLQYGYYPYFLEGIEPYLLRLNNVIEKVISEDVNASNNVKPTTLIVLKKLLWLVAMSSCLSPNMDKISKNLEVGRDIVYDGFEYLAKAGLISNIYPQAKGMKLIRKPAKIFMNNTNLLAAVNGNLALTNDVGATRETFFSNQIMAAGYSIHKYERADFMVDSDIVIEVGGRNKDEKQIKNLANAFLAVDDINVGVGKRLPLYLFGLLY